MYYWLFHDEEKTTPILKIEFDDFKIFHTGESLKPLDLDQVEIFFDIESFKTENIKGHFFRTDYFPIVSQRFVQLLDDNNITNYELFRLKALAKDGSQSKVAYYILNIIGNYTLKSMFEEDPQCEYHIFSNPVSFEYVTITEDFLNMLTKARGDEPWYVYTSRKFDFQWFKENHLKELNNIHSDLKKCYKSSPLGKPFTQEKIKQFLEIFERLDPYSKYLPNSGGGLPVLKKAKVQADDFKNRFLDKPDDPASYWLAQEIKMKVSNIFNYMETMCLD